MKRTDTGLLLSRITPHLTAQHGDLAPRNTSSSRATSYSSPLSYPLGIFGNTCSANSSIWLSCIPLLSRVPYR